MNPESLPEFEVQTLVIGAGVVGLAVGRALARAGREVIVAEAADAIGTETSSRNSEVIHAGIYYPQDSLKALCCVRGKHLLYEYCESHKVPYQRFGKLIVATQQDQLDTLEAIRSKAQANGVTDLQWISQARLQQLEPDLAGLAALFSPSTGIIDSHGYMLALQGDLEDAGGSVVLNSPVEAGWVVPGRGIRLRVGGAQPCLIQAREVINAAGLHVQSLLESIEGYPRDRIPQLRWAKGSYFSLTGKAPFQHLIYPVPEPGGLGVHLTLDLGGQARFGPDVEWVETLDYEVTERQHGRFVEQIARYWPGVSSRELLPAYSGIRPKLSAPGEPAADFVIEGENEHGVAGWVNLLGIESPGLTASLAIAEAVLQKMSEYSG